MSDRCGEMNIVITWNVLMSRYPKYWSNKWYWEEVPANI